MKKTTKVWLMIATSLILVGCILAKLFMVKYETTTYEVSKDFSDISISTDTADIIFALSDDGTCKVECYEEENAKHSVTVENDVLIVKTNKSWYDYIGYSFGWSKITIYLPKEEYSELSINESTGTVEIPNAIESLLLGRGFSRGADYDRESGKFEFSGKEYIPDFIIRAC